MTAKLSALSKLEDSTRKIEELISPESTLRRFKVANGSAVMPMATDYLTALALYHALLNRDPEDMTVVRVFWVYEDIVEIDCTECFPLPSIPRMMESGQQRKERTGLIRLQGSILVNILKGKTTF
jgi:hypothetical protein